MIFTIDIVDIIFGIVIIGAIVIGLFICVMYRVGEIISNWITNRRKRKYGNKK